MIDDLCTCEGSDRLGESAIPDTAFPTPCLLTGAVIAVRRILEVSAASHSEPTCVCMPQDCVRVCLAGKSYCTRRLPPEATVPWTNEPIRRVYVCVLRKREYTYNRTVTMKKEDGSETHRTVKLRTPHHETHIICTNCARNAFL